MTGSSEPQGEMVDIVEQTPSRPTHKGVPERDQVKVTLRYTGSTR